MSVYQLRMVTSVCLPAEDGDQCLFTSLMLVSGLTRNNSRQLAVNSRCLHHECVHVLISGRQTRDRTNIILFTVCQILKRKWLNLFSTRLAICGRLPPHTHTDRVPAVRDSAAPPTEPGWYLCRRAVCVCGESCTTLLCHAVSHLYNMSARQPISCLFSNFIYKFCCCH